ncbi:hypothetical protein NDU88_009705 [Pleurodeles waltl]|uniref:Uncharacterized protein n=1 Tax=Pleurodeles waltl TaxID=8319 RepID=A0AAV7PZS7_PLEWA|nr:hypothetical protein NDU88_009705 [Pleurodeles waltl]
MDRVLALMQPALMSLAQKGAEGNPVGGETPELEVVSVPDQDGHPRRAGVPPKSAFPPVPKRARKVAPKLGGKKSAPKRTLTEGTRDPNMGQADMQPEVVITGAVAGTTLGGAVSVSEREPGGDLVSGLAKVLPWLAKLGNAPQIDLASEGSALATLKGLAMGVGANLQGATTGTQEPPRATATTSHEPTSSIALPAVVATSTSTSPSEKQELSFLSSGEAWLVGKPTRPVGGKESCFSTKEVDNLGIKNTSAGELKTDGSARREGNGHGGDRGAVLKPGARVKQHTTRGKGEGPRPASEVKRALVESEAAPGSYRRAPLDLDRQLGRPPLARRGRRPVSGSCVASRRGLRLGVGTRTRATPGTGRETPGSHQQERQRPPGPCGGQRGIMRGRRSH